MAPECLNGSLELSAPKGLEVSCGAQGLKPHEEYQYLNLIRQILAEGEHRPDRYLTQAR